MEDGSDMGTVVAVGEGGLVADEVVIGIWY